MGTKKDQQAESFLALWDSFDANPVSKMIKTGIFVSPFVLILLFNLIIRPSLAVSMAFSTLCLSVFFLFVSFWMLVWILRKDVGTQSMLKVSEPIREGSEGFFMTQYGTIFKLAVLTAAVLFVVYLNRGDISPELAKYASSSFMAFLVFVSFILGANCSAISGYAGIWVSVRANVRTASAARKCYNEAL